MSLCNNTSTHKIIHSVNGVIHRFLFNAYFKDARMKS